MGVPFFSLADKREFAESPMPGYTGYVPKKQEHELGSTYGTWSGRAYVDALASKKLQATNNTVPIAIGRYEKQLVLLATIHINLEDEN